MSLQHCQPVTEPSLDRDESRRVHSCLLPSSSSLPTLLLLHGAINLWPAAVSCWASVNPTPDVAPVSRISWLLMLSAPCKLAVCSSGSAGQVCLWCLNLQPCQTATHLHTHLKLPCRCAIRTTASQTTKCSTCSVHVCFAYWHKSKCALQAGNYGCHLSNSKEFTPHIDSDHPASIPTEHQSGASQHSCGLAGLCKAL